MKPILYMDERSPPVRSVLMLIKMLALEVDLKFIDLFKGDQCKPEFKELNPAHTVPVLVDNELILTDSHVILIHLCEKYGGEQFVLWPKDYNERMKVFNQLMFESTVLFRRDSEMMSQIIHKKFDNIDHAYHKRKLYDIFDMMETYLSRNKFLALDRLTIADLSAVTTLSTVNLIFPIEAESPPKWPRLAQWFRNMKLMPEYQINQKGLNKFRVDLELFGKFKCPNGGENENE